MKAAAVEYHLVLLLLWLSAKQHPAGAVLCQLNIPVHHPTSSYLLPAPQPAAPTVIPLVSEASPKPQKQQACKRKAPSHACDAAGHDAFQQSVLCRGGGIARHKLLQQHTQCLAV